MDRKIISTFIFIFIFIFALSLPLQIEPAKPDSQITVMGFVYCDACANNTFSRHSYFIPGVEVQIECKFKAISAQTTEEILFSANRTTDKYGVYKLKIPSVDGIQCARDKAIESSCRASLMRTSSSSCNVPGFRSTSDQISVKSIQENLCIYSLNALNYRPSRKDFTLCKN